MASKEPLVGEMKDGDGCYLGPPKSHSAHRIISYKTMRVKMCLLETMELSLDRDNRTIPRYSIE